MSAIRRYLPPLVTFVLIIAAWEFASRGPDAAFILPRPWAVVQSLIDGYIVRGTLWEHLFTTLFQTIFGFIIGCVVAVVLAALVVEFEIVDRSIYPYIIALQSMPKVALAPLLIVWFGFGMASKVVLVALICFFPMFVNAVTGLRSVPIELVDLYRAFSASRWRMFFEIKIPTALPSFFAGLQIAVVFALLGAVVGEFIASQKGLGSVIQAASVSFNLPIVFACIISLSCLGAVMTALVRFTYRRVVFWQRTATKGDS
ncbi:Putative aliphatic sulfonates transport permease protein SsuC (plasmid) [Aminobacter sp. MSH1]|uniref:ABC transporter permease n=1 Tax=Aminobacter sp. MSH1 TaxID=374606 RepID=UPI000D3A5951|nr:ABC transporter permease [Aminobacter sp. MSH1]AWC25829.1 Putative aliphatic sulfonates transport permease protein SsuC [Aminobacter sp. MSH1]